MEVRKDGTDDDDDDDDDDNGDDDDGDVDNDVDDVLTDGHFLKAQLSQQVVGCCEALTGHLHMYEKKNRATHCPLICSPGTVLALEKNGNISFQFSSLRVSDEI